MKRVWYAKLLAQCERTLKVDFSVEETLIGPHMLSVWSNHKANSDGLISRMLIVCNTNDQDWIKPSFLFIHLFSNVFVLV